MVETAIESTKQCTSGGERTVENESSSHAKVKPVDRFLDRKLRGSIRFHRRKRDSFGLLFRDVAPNN